MLHGWIPPERFLDYLNVPNNAASLLSEKERELGIHAGAAETALLMALLPEQVKHDKLICEYPPQPPVGSLLSMEGRLTFAWLTHDLTRSGVIGDATAASPAMGALLLDSLAAGWARLIPELHRFTHPT